MKSKSVTVMWRICLFFLTVLFAVLGFFALKTESTAVAQGAEHVGATSLFSVSSGANISSELGVRISSDNPYSGEIKGIFKGDATLKFRFPEEYTDWWDGDFKVRVADVNDENNYFEVYYRPDDTKYHYTGAYVLYKDQIRSSRYYADNDGTRHTRNTYGSGDYALSAPSFRSFYSLNGNVDRNTREGILNFVWVGDVLQVEVNTFGSNATAVRTIAAFDGTTTFVSKGDWGLPKLNFANGYVISVSSSFTNANTTDKATDVLFTSVENGDEICDLTATEFTAPSFYTEYLEWKAINPSVKEDITELVKTNGTASAENGLRISSDDAYTGTFEGVFHGNTTLKFRFPEENSEWWSGYFVVRFSDALDATNYFEVEYRNVDEQYKYTGAFAVYKGQVRTSRYYQSDNAWRSSYVNGEYALCSPTFGNVDGRAQEGVLRLVWENDVLQVKVSHFTNGSMRTIAAFDGTEEFVSGTSWGLPKLNFENGYVISFSSEFSHKDTTDKGTDVCFSEIAGVNFVMQSQVDVAYNFETEFENPALKDGVLYIPQNENVGNMTAIYTRYISGECWLERETVDVTRTIDTSVIGENTILIEDDTWKDTPLGEVRRTYTLHVETPYTLTFDTNGGEEIAPIVHSEHTTERIIVQDAEKLFWQFDGWYIGDEKYDGNVETLYNRNITLTAAWKDVTPPVISLAEGIENGAIFVKGQSVALLKTDVKASDSAQNESVSVSIAWKKDDGEYTEVSDGYSLELVEAGTYSVCYMAKDGANLTAQVIRGIQVIERLSPVLNAENEYLETVFIGEFISVIPVTAQDVDGAELNVVVIVSKDGEKIEIQNGRFEVSKLGTYQVTYTATDKYGLVGLLTYAIEVVEDNELPIITVDFENKEVEKDTVVILPSAEVSDNVQEGISVSVKVTYGTKNIVIENNSFKAKDAGTYVVTYVALDKAGNTSQKVFHVTVKGEIIKDENDNQPATGCNCATGCSGSVGAGLPIGTLLFMVSIMLGKNLMKKKLKRKENR
ncbi:MAG: InlB B-repeat-containing protein [Clostridia bacterium]|nr:InlB B-repeat-containing protein [Clostridia bacterium]